MNADLVIGAKVNLFTHGRCRGSDFIESFGSDLNQQVFRTSRLLKGTTYKAEAEEGRYYSANRAFWAELAQDKSPEGDQKDE